MMRRVEPSGEMVHRAAGVLLASAAGDALGAGYEFGPPRPEPAEVDMVGGGLYGWEPGEWTDDTAMAWVIADVAASGADLRTEDAQDSIAALWWDWMQSATDVGRQTRAVLSAAASASDTGIPTAGTLQAAAESYHGREGQSGGNGSLMRTAPVALAYLDDPEGLVAAATAISALTHHDPEAGEACALWCLAIRHAVLGGDLDIRIGLSALPADRAEVWAKRIDVAEAATPAAFPNNPWVVAAFQGAWSAIHGTPVPAEDPRSASFAGQHLQRSLESAVRGGRDTDTVAAIAGGLLGARYGASAVPARWRRVLHGWPGRRARDLISTGSMIVRGGAADASGWPTVPRMDYRGYGDVHAFAEHPQDDRVLLAGVGHLNPLPDGVDAVISLCRLGRDEVPAGSVAARDHVEVWLVDSFDLADNPNLAFVLHDTVALLNTLRAEGRRVLVHCVQAHSRTPTIGVLHSITCYGVPLDSALPDVARALPGTQPNAAFLRVLGSFATKVTP